MEDQSIVDSTKLEFRSYRKEPVLDQDLDPLEFWKNVRSKYPQMIKLVKRYLCIPATSTEAERTYSNLSNLLTKKRLRMTGDSVNEQLFLKDKLKKNAHLFKKK